MDPKLRPRVTERDARAVLGKLWLHPVGCVMGLKDGEISAAFSFTSNGKDLILRIGRRPEDFEKDQAIAMKLCGSEIPVPEIYLVSEYEDFAVCVSQRLPGTLISDLPIKTQRELAPELIRVLTKIHETDISGTTGYGSWGLGGNAPYESAHAGLAAAIARLSAVATRYSDSEMTRALTTARKLAPFASEERYLLHSDFGGNNAVSDGVAVTGIFDWGSSAYGDRLRDIAWLDFWQTEISFADLYRESLRGKGVELPHFEERLRLYMYLEVAGSLEFFRDKGDLSARAFVCRRLATLDAENPGLECAI